MSFVSCASQAFASVHCCPVVTCWERAVLLAFVGDVYCIFVIFPSVILGQLWYLMVSFPDLCCPSYFDEGNLSFEFLNNKCADSLCIHAA